MFTEVKEDDLFVIDGGAYDIFKVAEFWAICYGAGYAIGNFFGNLFG